MQYGIFKWCSMIFPPLLSPFCKEKWNHNITISSSVVFGILGPAITNIWFPKEWCLLSSNTRRNYKDIKRKKTNFHSKTLESKIYQKYISSSNTFFIPKARSSDEMKLLRTQLDHCQLQRTLNNSLPTSPCFLDYNITCFYGLFLSLSWATETMSKTHRLLKPDHVWR